MGGVNWGGITEGKGKQTGGGGGKVVNWGRINSGGGA